MAVLGVLKGKRNRSSKQDADYHLKKFKKDETYFEQKVDGDTLFHRLCQNNEYDIIQALLTNKSFEKSGYIYGKNNNTILHYAAPFPDLYRFLSTHAQFGNLLKAKNSSEILPEMLVQEAEAHAEAEATVKRKLKVNLPQQVSDSPRTGSGSLHESPKSPADSLSALFKNLSLSPKAGVSDQLISEEWHNLLDMFQDYKPDDQIHIDKKCLLNGETSSVIEFLKKGGNPNNKNVLQLALSMAHSHSSEEIYVKNFLMLLYFSNDDFKFERLSSEQITLSFEKFNRVLLARSLRYKKKLDEINKELVQLVNTQHDKEQCPSPDDFKDPIDSLLIKICVSDNISYEEKMYMLQGIFLRNSFKDIFSRLANLARRFDEGTKYRVGYVGCMCLMLDFGGSQTKKLMLGQYSRADAFIESVCEEEKSKEMFKELCVIRKNYAQVVRRANKLRDILKQKTQLDKNLFLDLFEKALNKEKNDDLIRAIVCSIKEMTFEFYRNVTANDFIKPSESKVIQEFQENRNKLISFFSSQVLVCKDAKSSSKVLGLLLRIQQGLIMEEPGYPRDFSGFDLVRGAFNIFEISRLKQAFETLDRKSKIIFDGIQKFDKISPSEYAGRVPELKNYHESTLHHGIFLTQLSRFSDILNLQEGQNSFDSEIEVTGKVATDIARQMRNAALATYAITSDLEEFLKDYACISEAKLRKLSYDLEPPVVNLDKMDISNFNDVLKYLNNDILPEFQYGGKKIDIKDITETLLVVYEKKLQDKIKTPGFQKEEGERLIQSFSQLLDVLKGVLCTHRCNVEGTVSMGIAGLRAMLGTSFSPRALTPQHANYRRRSMSARRARHSIKIEQPDDLITLSGSSSGSRLN